MPENPLVIGRIARLRARRQQSAVAQETVPAHESERRFSNIVNDARIVEIQNRERPLARAVERALIAASSAVSGSMIIKWDR